MSIYLIRHGETPLNATRVIQFPDTPLSERGQAQATAIGERLSTAPLGAILTSDYQRAYATAEAIHRLNGASLSVVESLRERHFGDLRGKAFADLGVDPFEPGYAPPGGESWDVFHERAARAWGEILIHAAQAEGDLAVVTHGLVLRSLAQHVLTLADHVDYDSAGFANTCLTQIEGPPWQVELLACDLHLTDQLRATGGKV
jgi:2,3-bisphosphoglycerate-dependent phosphoglycerate mutase